MINRREHKRSITKKGVFVLFDSKLKELICINKMSMGEMALAVFKSNYRQIGKMVNISMGGTALHCFESNIRMEELSKIDILLAESRFYLPDIPFSIIDSYNANQEYGFNTSRMRKVSLQFKELTPIQLMKLEFFIKNHTVKV